eukprot:1391990-Pleurochrysis_carterae.AAC.1
MEASWSVVSIQNERNRNSVLYGGARRGARGYGRRHDDDAGSTDGSRGGHGDTTSSTTVTHG